MSKWFEIFRTGKFTAMNGKTYEYTEQDLDDIVSNYKPEEYEAPIVVGHPKTDSPAYGWVEKIKRVGNKLFALPKQLMPEFVDAVNEGRYKKRSIKLFNKKLMHVGFLGGAAPAVPGLKDVSFSANEADEEIEFGESDFKDDDDASADLPNGKAGSASETADQEFTGDEKKNLLAEIEKLTNQVNELQQFKDDSSKLEQKFVDATTAKEDAEAKLKNLYLKSRLVEFQTFLNERIAYGSIAGDMVTKVLKLLQMLDTVELKKNDAGTEVFEFSAYEETDKDGAKVLELKSFAFNPVDELKEFISMLKPMVEFDELANKKNAAEGTDDIDVSEFAEKENIDQDRLELHKKALKIQKEKNCSYKDAVIEASKK